MSGCRGQVCVCGRGLMNREWNEGTNSLGEGNVYQLYLDSIYMCIHIFKNLLECTLEMCTFPLCKLHLKARL